MSTPTFIVSTGRCGSTLLSRALNGIPSILVLSELFVTIDLESFGEAPLKGDEFWNALSHSNRETRQLLALGLGTPEYLTQSPADIPPLMITALPFVSSTPDVLYAGAKRFVCNLASANPAKHLASLFNWLATSLGREVWVERSGGSLRHVDTILRLFPDAKFVHIFRDGRESAISMSKHHAFRMAVIRTMVEERGAVDYWADPNVLRDRDLFGELAEFLPDNFDISAYEQLRIPIERFGALWSSQILKGLSHLTRLPSSRVHSVRYEDLLAKPEEHLPPVVSFIAPGASEITDVLAIAKRDWRMPPLRWPYLGETERERLLRSCKIALRLLGYDVR